MIKQLDWSEWELDKFSYHKDIYSCIAITGDFYHLLVEQNSKFKYTFGYRLVEPNRYPIERELRLIFLPEEIDTRDDAKKYVYYKWVETVQSILMSRKEN